MIKVVFLIVLFPPLLFSATSPKCPGQDGYFYTNDKSKRNPRQGGFVASSANVGDYVFIAPTAAVCDSSSVIGFARVYGNAIVRGEAEVKDKARVYGDALVQGEAQVSGEAKVSGHAQISGTAIVTGNAWAKGYVVLSKGTQSKGTFSAPQPKWVGVQKQAEMNSKNTAAALNEQRSGLESFQRGLSQGWYGMDKSQGFYRNFKFRKGDIKPPCGFFMKLTKEEKILDSHCRKTKKVRRKIWTPKGGDWEYVKDCDTQYVDQGEKYFNLNKLIVKSSSDFSNSRDYLDFNGYFFYVGNSRRVTEYMEKLKSFARKHCGFKG